MNRPVFERSPGFALPRVVVVAIAIVSAFGSSRPCRGDLIIELPTLIAPSGSTGSFDVDITNTNSPGGASYEVASDVLELSLSGTSGVEFTSVGINTTLPYIYMVSGTQYPGGSLSSDQFPNTDFTASDSEFAFAVNPSAEDQRTIAPGQSYGLLHVTYSVGAQASGSSGSIELVASGSNLSDDQFNSTSFSTTGGSFIVVSVVPEPSTLLMLAIGGACLLGLGSMKFSRSPCTKFPRAQISD